MGACKKIPHLWSIQWIWRGHLPLADGFEPSASSISYQANAHSGSYQAGPVKSNLVNDIPLSLVFMILISSVKIKD
jgi:hypothetical protein